MDKQLKYIKPFLVLLNIMPDKVYGVGKQGNVYVTDNIEMDITIIEALRKI
jgi:hypothetical protein